MNTSDRQVREAEAWLKQAAEGFRAAHEERDRAIRETESLVTRRRAGDLTGLTSSAVQQIVNAPWTHRVRFVGALDDEANEALREAGIELRTSRGGGVVAPGADPPPPDNHTVYLKADDSEEALRRVQGALEGSKSFSPFKFAAFKVEPVSPSRRR
jgi:hypothetical protein